MVSLSAWAATLHVPGDFPKIEAAIDAATHGDEIVVATGTYWESIQMQGKNLTVRSVDPFNPEIVAQTIIQDSTRSWDGSYAVSFSGAEDSSCALVGVTILEGGVRGNHCHATIEYCRVNTYYVGIFEFDGDIRHNLLEGCWPALEDCDGIISANRIRGNRPGLLDCDGVIQNNLIYNNVSYGGGAALRDCDGIIQGNTIYGNKGFFEDWRESLPPYVEGSALLDCNAVIRDCIVWGNISETGGSQIHDCSAPSFCCLEDWNGDGTGNIFTDPRFVDAENEDFRLSANSYCIDSGSFVAGLGTDLEGNARGLARALDARGDGSHFDIGAYEFTGSVLPNEAPQKPSNLTPMANEPGVVIPPLLTASSFVDPDPGNVHGATQWQIDDDDDFSSPELDSGADPRDLERKKVLVAPIQPDTLYHWRVRYMDNQYLWSPWSDATAFRTAAANWLFVPDGFATIQAAIDSATTGDEIVVRAGRYFENLQLHGADIILRSLDPEDPNVVAGTVLDGSHSGSVVTFAGTESPACILAGFTITNGCPSWGGGGIDGFDTHATIRCNRITDNPGDWPEIPFYGGGLVRCQGTIEHNVITRNKATFGGGMRLCSGTIRFNEISWNYAIEGAGFRQCGGSIHNNVIAYNGTDSNLDDTPSNYHGGAMYSCFGQIFNNLIYGNSTAGDGAIFAWSDADFVNNTISGNDGKVFFECDGAIKNNIVWNSRAFYDSSVPSYCLYPSWRGEGVGNLSSNPRFVDSDNRDYRLRPDSPCIDAGTIGPSEDFDGSARPYDSVAVERGDGSNYDIGAYEYVGPGTPNPPPNTPVNVFPAEGATGIPLWFSLVCSEFSDPATDDQHIASEWQLWPVGGPYLIIYTGVDYEHLTSFPISYENRLQPETAYTWRVRHYDAYGSRSEWSVATVFVTRGTRTVTVPGDYPTIQAAIDEAISGDEIVVAPGLYKESINFNGKNLILRSTDPEDPGVVASTIIEGVAGAETVLLGGAGKSAVLAGFTITGRGRGITGDYSEATIRNNRILGHSTVDPYSGDGHGGAMTQCDGSIVGNTILWNKSQRGGALYGCDGSIARNVICNNTNTALLECNATIEDNIISDNLGDGLQDCDRKILNNHICGNLWRGLRTCHGTISGNIITNNNDGGLLDCNGIIIENIISHNSSVDSAGVSSSVGQVISNLICWNSASRNVGGVYTNAGIVRNNMIFSNSAGDHDGGVGVNGGILEGNTIFGNSAGSYWGGIGSSESKATLRNNIIWGNTAPRYPQLFAEATPSYCCIQDWEGGGIGNISADPRLRNPDRGDFSLLPTSPCIDAGGYVADLSVDFEGDPRPTRILAEPRGDGSGFDIGADEYFLFHNAGSDLNTDWFVDFLDLFVFQEDWHAATSGAYDTDLNDDEAIDALDLFIMLEDWHHGSGP